MLNFSRKCRPIYLPAEINPKNGNKSEIFSNFGPTQLFNNMLWKDFESSSEKSILRSLDLKKLRCPSSS